MRYVLLILMFLFVPHLFFAQQIETSFQTEIQKIQLSQRWHLSASAKAASVFKTENSNYRWFNINSELNFNIYNSIYAFLQMQYSCAKYNGIENSEQIYTIAEGVRLTTKHQFKNQLIFEQRRLIFNPSDFKTSASRFTYCFARLFVSKSEKWCFCPETQISFNINSEVYNSQFVQRYRLYGLIQRKISNQFKLGLKYGYMFGEKEQSYMGDSHNLNSITIQLSM